MSKKSNTKNIIIANLPAAAALLLMAAALKLTLEFSFIISLIVLVVVYFLLGVTIELIMEKAQAKKKRENLFKQFSEGDRSNLPTGRSELYAENEFEEPTFSEEEEVIDEESSSFDEAAETELEDIDEKPLEDDSYIEEVYTEEIQEDDFEEPEFSEDVVEDEDFEETVVSDADTFREIVVDNEESEDVDAFFAGIFGDGEELSGEEDVVEEPTEEVSDSEFTIDDIPEDENAEVSEEDTEEDFEEPVFPEETEEFVEVEEIAEEPVEEAEVQDSQEDAYDVLKEMGVVPEEEIDNTPEEEKEARRSLFDGGDFDTGSDAGFKPSVLFGSVPDTEDDLEYIPPVIDNANAPKKGKVQVDSQKIDELYAFKKAEKGESFFGKRRK